MGFRSNGTMTGKIHWSMLVQGFTVLISGTHEEMRAANGKLPLVSSWTLAGKRPNSRDKVLMVAMSIAKHVEHGGVTWKHEPNYHRWCSR